jgi:hypothetical protein
MKYRVLAIICSISFGLSAQITISSSDLFLPVTPDTAFGRVATFLGLSLPSEGVNQSWDYSTMNATIFADFSLKIPDTNVYFPQALGMNVENSTLAGVTIEDNKSYYHFDANGIYYTGYQLKQKTYDMNAITGGVEDEVTVLGHHVNYGSSVVRYKMPMTYLTSWTNNYRETVPMEFDIMGFGNPGDSVVIINDYEENYEVVGWGSLTMPANLGIHDALLLKHKTVRIDSVYLNGFPAPPFFVSGSGLAQGDTTVTAYYELMIRGINRSAIRFNTDTGYNFIQTVDFCTVPSVFGLPEKQLPNVQVYPNPTKTGVIHLAFNKPTDALWQLNAYTLTGEFVQQLNVTQPKGICELNISLPEVNGVYLITLQDENGNVRLARKIVKN